MLIGPTIVLVHGAFAESASRNSVIDSLEIPGASRALAVSQPHAVADLILEAAALPAAA
jgi:hypothetical protein